MSKLKFIEWNCDMKIFLLSAVMLLLAGCCKESFYAVSIAGNENGGVYQDFRQVLHLPQASYIIRKNDTLYITQNAARKSADKSGAVYAVDREAMKILQRVKVNGITPCHAAVSPDGNFLYTANYSSGNVSEIPLENGIPCPQVRIIQHQGKGKDPRRQKSPHPHFAGFDPAGKQLFVCDLGTDEIWVYNYTKGKGVVLPEVEKLKLPPGSGPRHLAFAPDGKTIYTANELDSTATSFIKTSGSWKMVKTISTRLEVQAAKKNFPGAIKITSDGRFFFITNRGDDTIAVFKTSGNGNFELIANVDALGKYPSDILLDEKNQVLYTVNLKNGTAAKFKMNLTAGTLEAMPEKYDIPRGISLCK